jgi:ribosomal protein S4
MAGPTPPWLLADPDGLKGTVNRLPAREDISAPIEERLIVEHYSR